MIDEPYEYVADDYAAERAADSTVRYAFSQPRTLGIVAFGFAVAIVVSAIRGGGVPWAIADVVVGLAAVALIFLAQRRRLRRAFAALRYRPGSVLRVTYGPDAFTLTTVDATARYRYGNILKILVRADRVMLVLRPRLALVLPRQLVPDERVAFMRALIAHRPE